MNGIGKIVKTRAGELAFSLLSGFAYYIIITAFIIGNTNAGGALLGFFFLPAIVCGIALILIKSIRSLKEEEQFAKINFLVYPHILLWLISIAFLFDMLLNK